MCGALDGGFVPPMAVAALAIRALLERAGLPPGAVHRRQELTFTAQVRRGETLAVSATILSRDKRPRLTVMGVELRVTRGGDTVMNGEATIWFPDEGAVA